MQHLLNKNLREGSVNCKINSVEVHVNT